MPKYVTETNFYYSPANDGLSRTAVDLNRLYLDSAHTGPMGRGGHAWVSDRASGNIMQYDLRNGHHRKTYITRTAGRGFGIGVQTDTGNCIAGPGKGQVIIRLCDINNPGIRAIAGNVQGEIPTTLTRSSSAGRESINWAYGIIPLYGYNNRMFIADHFREVSNSPNIYGRPGIYSIETPLSASRWIPCDYKVDKVNSEYPGLYTYIVKTQEGVTYNGYAATSCPNGMGLQAGNANVYCYFINPSSAHIFAKDMTLIHNVNGYVRTVIPLKAKRISTDNYLMYPNTIINNAGDNRNIFCICNGDEYSVYAPISANVGNDVKINWALNIQKERGSSYERTTYEPAPGYDGENNLWKIQTKKGKTKVYRTAGDWFANDGIDETVIFPYGGRSRYPNIPLNEWPSSTTNTTEIEWFLTRAAGLSTYRWDLCRRKTYPSIGYEVFALSEIDPPTLDNSEVVDWYPGVYSPQTAYQAWWSLVDQKMLRVSLAKGEGGGSFIFGAKNSEAGWLKEPWKTAPYFKVYDNDDVSEDIYSRKWGIRMSLSGIPGVSASNYDLFYETERDTWEPIIINRINKWSAAFADKNTGYSTITGLTSAAKTILINNNLSGITVQSFWKFATGITQTSESYIADWLPQTTKNNISYYANNLKYYDFGSEPLKDIYMYSDFTGNILSKATNSILSTNISVIGPSPTEPTISLSVSGYQSNNGYQDTPAYCYPWKNTLPSLMSAHYTSISGYDDFTVNFLISCNMGSYWLTSFLLSTDDFNSQILNITKNIQYDSSNNAIATINYTYNNPTINGLYYLPYGNPIVSAYEHVSPCILKPNGKFNPKIGTNTVNVYDYRGGLCQVVNLSSESSISIFERWPEPKFYLDIADDDISRRSIFCHNKWGDLDKADSIYKESNSVDAKRYDITYGVDPISAAITNRSIARTWPISSGCITISTNNLYLGWDDNAKSFDIPMNITQDTQSYYELITSLPFRYGKYNITMNVQASTTSTSSDKFFIQYVNVSEFEPYANFYMLSAETLPSSFCIDTDSISASLVNTITAYNGEGQYNNTIFNFISGYAPNLTVYFKDTSEAHTFPISSYQWNFGDPFNEGPADITDIRSNYYTITNVQILNGDFNHPCWLTDKQNHIVSHTYIMPGTYDVTLTVKASSTSTSNICAKYTEDIGEQYFHVYVEEISPRCNEGIFASVSCDSEFTNTIHGITGDTTALVYFMASSIIAGSFPIGRMDWDFGDGDVQIVTRYPLTEKTNQNINIYNGSFYVNDQNDPRNMVIPHIYNNSSLTNQTYNISVSAYACNTNTMIYCSGGELVGPITPAIEQRVDGQRNLIGSRFDERGNLIYTLEGKSSDAILNELHTVILTNNILTTTIPPLT